MASSTNQTDELLRMLIIIKLGLAGLTQDKILKIVGGDIHRVNRIVKYFKDIKKSKITKVKNTEHIIDLLEEVIKIIKNK